MALVRHGGQAHPTGPPTPRKSRVEEPWKASRTITDELKNDPKSADRLRKSRRHAREGELIWPSEGEDVEASGDTD